MYFIYDWAGNELWRHGSFPTFEDAWDYICEHFQEDDFEDLCVDTKRKIYGWIY